MQRRQQSTARKLHSEHEQVPLLSVDPQGTLNCLGTTVGCRLSDLAAVRTGPSGPEEVPALTDDASPAHRAHGTY
jgi:hypothetical protein